MKVAKKKTKKSEGEAEDEAATSADYAPRGRERGQIRAAETVQHARYMCVQARVSLGTMVDGAAKLYGLRSVLGRGDGPHSMDYPPTRWP